MCVWSIGNANTQKLSWPSRRSRALHFTSMYALPWLGTLSYVGGIFTYISSLLARSWKISMVPIRFPYNSSKGVPKSPETFKQHTCGTQDVLTRFPCVEDLPIWVQLSSKLSSRRASQQAVTVNAKCERLLDAPFLSSRQVSGPAKVRHHQSVMQSCSLSMYG